MTLAIATGLIVWLITWLTTRGHYQTFYKVEFAYGQNTYVIGYWASEAEAVKRKDEFENSTGLFHGRYVSDLSVIPCRMNEERI